MTTQTNSVQTDTAVDRSCTYQLTDGASAPLPHASKPYVTTTSFAKAFDQTHLDNVASASMEQTAKYVESLGVKLYKTSAWARKKCVPFSGLTLAPNDAQDVWNSFEESLQSGLVVFGMYLPRGFMDLSSVSSSPVIVIRQEATRWVLVHEMLHHLFEDEFSKTHRLNGKPMTGWDLQKEYGKKRTRRAQILNELANSSSLDDKSELYEEYLEIVELLDLQNVHYPLEEMTIESILIQRFRAGQFSYFPDETQNAEAYVSYSAEKIGEDYRKLAKEVGALLSLASITKVKPSTLAKLESMRARFLNRQTELESVNVKYGGSKFGIVGGGTSSAAKIPLPPCGRPAFSQEDL